MQQFHYIPIFAKSITKGQRQINNDRRNRIQCYLKMNMLISSIETNSFIMEASKSITSILNPMKEDFIII